MTAQKIINKAVSQIGVKEVPANSNNVKYNTEYYGRAVNGSSYPWCCAFVWWIFNACGAPELFYGGKKTAYCPTVEGYYKSLGKWYNTGKAGDLVLFDFSKKGIAGHIGIVESVNSDGSYTTIEGNTGSGNDANGGAVMRRTRYKSTIRGFARPDYGSDEVVFNESYVDLIGTVTANVLNIRSKPTTSSSVIGKHSNGDIVDIVAKTDNGWYKVNYPNIGTGYLFADYISVKERTVEPTPVEQQPYTPSVEEPKDNVPDTWAESAVQEAINKKIICGDENGNLKLHKNCTRQEMLVFLYRFYKNMI